MQHGVDAARSHNLCEAALAIARPSDTERVMIRANAWSSLAGIVSPLVIGATIGIGIGWVPGMASLGRRMNKSTGQISQVRSDFVEMELDHDTGAEDRLCARHHALAHEARELLVGEA